MSTPATVTPTNPQDIKLPAGYRTTAMDCIKDVNLDGKVAIVTGASSGIGVETARALAHAGAHVILAVRDLEKTGPVLEDIRKKPDSAAKDRKVEAAVLDLNSLASVRAFAKQFLENHTSLHYLILNAGVMAIPNRELTKDGFEVSFGVNFLANFLLGNLLVPALLEAKNARVVVVSSCAHLRSDVIWDDLQFAKSYDKTLSYASSKTAAILFSNELNRQLQPRGVMSFSLHPGGIFTNLQQHMTMEEKTKLGWFDKDGNPNPLFKTVEQGAATTVYAAVSKELDGKGGLYLEDCAPSIPTPRWPVGYAAWSQNAENAKKLWAIAEDLVSEKFNWEAKAP